MAKDYHLGTTDEELERLGYQHQVWQEVVVSLWRAAGFGLGQSLLDLGCGPGFATLDLARLVGPGGVVHGIDASEKFIRFLDRQGAASGLPQIRTRVADVHALDLPDSTLDGAFARWVLCFVEDPARVVGEVARVLRPGGAFVVLDYFNYLAVNVFPRRESVASLFRAYHRSAIGNKGSYDIGERLPELLRAHGMEVEVLEPICHTARPGSPLWEWLSLFNHSYTPKLVEQGLWTAQDYAAFQSDWRELSDNPDAFFFTPPVLGVVARKAGRGEAQR